MFRGQGRISGERQVELSGWFGPCESTFYKHPRSPHPDVFRVSNDRAEGCTGAVAAGARAFRLRPRCGCSPAAGCSLRTPPAPAPQPQRPLRLLPDGRAGVGRTGWHVDGSFQAAPFSHALYHIWECPSAGDTLFVPLHELLAGLPPEQRRRWERLWMLSDRRERAPKPLVYTHPLSGLDTLCFHLGVRCWGGGCTLLRGPSPGPAGTAQASPRTPRPTPARPQA